MGRGLGKTAKFRQKSNQTINSHTGGEEMHFPDLLVIAEVAVVLGLMAFAVYKNKVGKYTKGLPWPLESVVVWLLSRVGGSWSREFFLAMSRITVLTAVVQVILRRSGGSVEVFLAPRNDETYRDMVHVPGAFARYTDKAGFFADAIARVTQRELAGFPYSALYQAGNVLIINTPLGKVTLVVLVGEPGPMDKPKVAGAWHNVEALPENLVPHELDFVRTAVAEFCQRHGMKTIVPKTVK